jgi:hypothetical protein
MARNVISHELEDDYRKAESAVYDTGKTVRDLIETRRAEIEREEQLELAALIYIVFAAFVGLCLHWADLSTIKIIEIELAMALCAAGVWCLIRRRR